MVEPQRELLVLLDPNRCDEALTELRAVAPVTAQVRPGVVLVAIDPGRAGELATIDGVAGVYVAEPPPEATLADLSPGERLFIDGWVERAHLPHHPGDGLPWDDPGHRPPDVPPGSSAGDPAP